ncbi:MAG: glycosyltransferase [Thermodesulfobacteriota bacterium]
MARVLHLDLGREMRGGQRQVLYLARRQRISGRVEPLAACPAGSPLAAALAAEGAEVLALPSGREWDPRNILRLRRFLSERQVALLHTHDARAAALGALLKLLGGRFRLVHSRRVSYAPGRGWGRFKYRLADLVLAVSAETAEVLAACGAPRERLAVAHSGIDPSLYPARRPKAPDAPLVIAAVGALTPQKGHEVFLRGLAALRDMPGLPAWRARLLGEGPLRGGLESLAAELGLGDRLELPGWRESREELPDADILAVASVHGEGSSAVIKEAWACGLPVAASDLPSNLELVEPGASGAVFASGDPGALARALAGLLSDPALREELAEGGRRRLERFTDAAMAAAVQAGYERAFPELFGSPASS